MLVIAKATQGFVAMTNNPPDKYIVNINKHSLAGVILTEYCYKHIYKQGPYVVPSVVSVYDVTIKNNTKKR